MHVFGLREEIQAGVEKMQTLHMKVVPEREIIIFLHKLLRRGHGAHKAEGVRRVEPGADRRLLHGHKTSLFI